MLTSAEQKTVQAWTLEIAETIGWTVVPRKEAEQRRGGIPAPSPRGGAGDRNIPPPPERQGSTSPRTFFNPRAKIDVTMNRLHHWQQGEAWVFVTWRLDDSLPKAKLEQWTHQRALWMGHHPEPWDDETEAGYHELFSGQFDEWLDLGSGSCVLSDASNAAIVSSALRHFDGDRYEIASFVVMPNHVHVLFRPLGKHRIPEIVKSWKGFTAREINKRLGKIGPLWQDDYWDRLIRSEPHFLKVAQYIRENPEKAKLRDGMFILWEK